MRRRKVTWHQQRLVGGGVGQDRVPCRSRCVTIDAEGRIPVRPEHLKRAVKDIAAKQPSHIPATQSVSEMTRRMAEGGFTPHASRDFSARIDEPRQAGIDHRHYAVDE
jgi:hypothetical protein